MRTQSRHRVATSATKSSHPEWIYKDPSVIPVTTQVALRKALKLENLSASEFDDFSWLIAQESGGQVNVRNPKSSARGLFQLLRNQYALNPHGESSFGDAVEESQGGIRYVIGRYRSARAAKQFWIRHHWY